MRPTSVAAPRSCWVRSTDVSRCSNFFLRQAPPSSSPMPRGARPSCMRQSTGTRKQSPSSRRRARSARSCARCAPSRAIRLKRLLPPAASLVASLVRRGWQRGTRAGARRWTWPREESRPQRSRCSRHSRPRRRSSLQRRKLATPMRRRRRRGGRQLRLRRRRLRRRRLNRQRLRRRRRRRRRLTRRRLRRRRLSRQRHRQQR